MSNTALVFLSALLIFWAFPPPTAESRLRTFHIIEPIKTNRETAEEECNTSYTGLVTVYDQQDNMNLSKLISKTPNASSAWIGTYGGNRSMKWSNGDDVTFNRSLTCSGEMCCAAINADGNWASLQCREKKHFMCYEQDVGRNQYNYRLIRENRNWSEAQLYCRQYHTDLVSIRDETENERVMKAKGEHNNPFWIGLLEDSVVWAGGGQSAYRNWSLNSRTSSYPGAYMDSKGNWYKNTGSTSFPLCYKSFIHVSENNMSWEKAMDYCNNQTNTTGPLTIHSENDQIETERELRRTVHNIIGPVWVGLRQSRLFGFWIWINGLHVGNYSNWKGGSPPEHQISLHCGAIEKVDGQYKWVDKDCRKKYRVLCEMI